VPHLEVVADSAGGKPVVLADCDLPIFQIYLNCLCSGKFELSKKVPIGGTGRENDKELPDSEYLVVMRVKTYNMALSLGDLGACVFKYVILDAR
jgi:hypothetical protein